MEKNGPPQYGSPPPPGIIQPPEYSPPNAYPPNTYPVNTSGSSMYPPTDYPPNNYPPTNYPPQPASSTVVITGNPTVITNFGPDSRRLVCPYCHHSVSTRVENKATTKTHLYALLLCMCLCWLCCCCPYCLDSCQGRNHYCPKCNAFLGIYSN